MIRGRLYQSNNRLLLLNEVMLTSNALERMRGLLGRPALTRGQGLLIRPCNSVHTIGMRYPIDLIFLDRQWVIKKLVHALPPWRLAWSPGAHMVIELPGATLTQFDLESGTELLWEDDA